MYSNKRAQYTADLLTKYMIRDAATFVKSEDDEINNRAVIYFICNCGENALRSFRLITMTGAFCKKCIQKRANEKRMATNMEIYGCEFTVQAESVKAKARETCLRKYGVPNPSMCPDFYDKFKATCIERYGKEHPMMHDYFIHKMKTGRINHDNLKKLVADSDEYVPPS
jgi:hypothetical protein